MKTLALLFAMLLGLATSASAQALDKVTLRIYLVGAAAPLSTSDFLAANILCNQPAPAAGALTTNPNRVVFNDDAAPPNVCIWSENGTGPLAALPFGATAYEATLTATNGAGTSPESSPRVPFSRPGQAPGVRTGLRLVR